MPVTILLTHTSAPLACYSSVVCAWVHLESMLCHAWKGASEIRHPRAWKCVTIGLLVEPPNLNVYATAILALVVGSKYAVPLYAIGKLDVP